MSKFSKERIKYFAKNWKLGVHLLFRTKHFGVNNKRWADWDSMFGWSNRKKIISILLIYPIIENYRCMKFRAGACHFMSDESYELAFGEKKTKRLDEWYEEYKKTETKEEKERNKRMEEETIDEWYEKYKRRNNGSRKRNNCRKRINY